MEERNKYKNKTVFREKYTDIRYLKILLLGNAILLIVYLVSKLLE